MSGRMNRGNGGDIEMGGNRGMQNMQTSSAKSDTSSADFDEKETDYQPVDWKKVLFTPKYAVLWVVLIIVGALTVVISLKHDQVVAALTPFAKKVRDIPAGWLIFVAVLFIISFPPLFGHEMVALLAGVVYGLWMGFAVVAAGTFVGEIGTWFAFKKFLRKKAEKMERTNLAYGSMAKLCRDGGFWIVFIIRLSIVPSHMSTAVFSTCDVKFWHFAVSTFFTLPKQLILVYLGVLLVGGHSDFWVKFWLFGVAGVVTVGTGVWIWLKMAKIKKELLAQQAMRKAGVVRNNNNGYGGPIVVGASQANLDNFDNVSLPPTNNNAAWRQGGTEMSAPPYGGPPPPRYNATHGYGGPQQLGPYATNRVDLNNENAVPAQNFV